MDASTQGITSRAGRFFTPLAAVAGGGVVSMVALVVAGASRKFAVALLLSYALFLLVAITRRPREIFLFSWAFLLCYNRQYFLVPAMGSQSPYFILSDFFLLLLAAIWLYEVTILKRSPKPVGGRVWIWYLPFAIACLATVTVARRPDWTLIEMVRVLKVGFVLIYARYHLRERQWWLCLAALGAGMVFQGVLGITEVTTGFRPMLWLRGGQLGIDLPEVFRQEAYLGWRRATGTMDHPPNLACYFLLVVPVFIALGLTFPRRRLRIGFSVAALIGLGGLIATLSRWPWMLMGLQILVLLTVLAWRRIIPVKRAIAIVVIAGLVASLSALALIEPLSRRMTSDLGASVQLRSNGYRMALAMLRDHNLLLGVGLNNYGAYMLEYAAYDPVVYDLTDVESIPVSLNVRYLAGPLNGYLYVLTEAGVLGLAAFLLYLLGVFRAGFGALGATRGHRAAASLGLLIGLLGVLGQQAIDYSYWVDPILYSFALVVTMLNSIRSDMPPEQDSPEEHRRLTGGSTT